MADHYWGWIQFPAGMIDQEVKEALEAEGVGFDEHGVIETRDGYVWIADGIFSLEDDQASYGQFEDLENLLRLKGIPFDRESGQAYEFTPELAIFRPAQNGTPALDRVIPLAGDSPEPIVKVQEILNLLPQGVRAVEAYLEAHYAYPALKEWRVNP